ncbi:D-glycero-beta-D-manno-heptose 1,7-bisphosphate 7-phosphatase [Geoalkalibacter sp.]|uniref:D-glycero-beta-D-manno-heptose 1,7-bisphosphate 7-phosphatase n=1 Tax=Geoalkalibacter sp. TaxID=3041440 RepID=UPI00272DE953|nr:D-glycero-beta-D-manno-heptose 1,7-bisphosphate 7-phosphatase [Geoalkalibacter sp.]
MRRAVFLDRDGTINVEKDYLFRPADFEFIPGAPEAIARLNRDGYLVVVVTNQSGVARGFFGIEEVRLLHEHLQRRLAAQGAAVDAFYLCPHHPEQGLGPYKIDCDCRKGQPGMLLQAAAEHGIDLTRSFMVGDKLADVQAGRRAGCRSLLVLTGYGREDAKKLQPGEAVVVADLSAAVDYILQTGEDLA